ncbi:MAG: hypothetical protein RL376_317, partial [Verrucomicrobiota bacterium]
GIWAGILVAVAAAGALRTGQERARLGEWDGLGLPPREARLTLRVERVFATPPGEARAGGLARVVGAEAHLRDLVGQRVQFSVNWPKAEGVALRGVEFVATGLLRPVPEWPEAGSFDRFLADEGVNFAFTRGRLAGKPGEAGAWVRFCATAGARLEASLRSGLGGRLDGLGDLYVAMLLGKKQELSEGQQALFIRSGTMHLFAVSGLHVAGIAMALNTLLAIVRVPGRVRFLVGTGVLWTFVEITGGSPSAVRAFWMVTCLLGAQQFRAPGNSLAALVTSALGVLVVAPHQLFSASFQMSYGIVAALLLYGVPLQEMWLERWRPWAILPRGEWRAWQHGVEAAGRGVISAVALGLASVLVSTPATLAFFGLLTPGGFFVNLVLIPVSSLVLFAGVAAMLVGGMGWAGLASVFNHGAALVLAGMEGAVELALRVPGMAWKAQFVAPWCAPVASAGMLALLAVGYARGWRAREGGYWLPFAVLGLGLVLTVRGV